jgi:hypothetical protein
VLSKEHPPKWRKFGLSWATCPVGAVGAKGPGNSSSGIGLTDGEGAEILDCSREAFRQRVSRARRTIRYVIDNRWVLVDPDNPCRCGRQIGSGEAAGILDRNHLLLAEHPREKVRVWIEPVAKQLDEVVAIGDLYRFDRFKAPAELWDDLQQRFKDVLEAR